MKDNSTNSGTAKNTSNNDNSKSERTLSWILQVYLLVVVCITILSVALLHTWMSDELTINRDHNDNEEILFVQGNKESIHDINKAVTKNNDGFEYRIVFSTGCMDNNWQAYTMFYHAYKSKQEGHVTRVASGCSDKDGKKLIEKHRKEIEPLRPGYFHLHLTPNYKFVLPGVEYEPFNQVFGLRHWVENGLQYPSNVNKYENDIFIVLNPEQIIMRPITNNFTDETILWRNNNERKERHYYVKHGVPFGQEYAVSDNYNWVPKMKMEKIAPKNELPSPVNQLSVGEAADEFPVGPPYIMTGRDFDKIVTKWADFAPRVYKEKPGPNPLLYSYSIAAAHLQLSHQILQSLMVSNYDDGATQGWALIDDQFSHQDVCAKPSQDRLILESFSVPYTLYFAHRYMLGKWFLNKFFVPKNIISCEAPLFREPPNDLSIRYDFGITRDGYRQNFTNADIRKRIAFALCQTIYAINEAATHFKMNNCDRSTVNMNRTFVFHNDMELKWKGYL